MHGTQITSSRDFTFRSLGLQTRQPEGWSDKGTQLVIE